MRILGWKAEGLRCPDHEISCADSEGRPSQIVLIQMPNGTGKTTTLDLLRATLSGSARDGKWEVARVKEYQKKGALNSDGVFEVRLLLNDKRVTIIMYFDFESGRIHYKTTRGSGQEDGFDPPNEFKRFLHDNFVNFFVFDGELAEHLLDKTRTDAELVVEALFQINSIVNVRQSVADYWQTKAENTEVTEGDATKKQLKLNRWRERLDSLLAEQARLTAEREQLILRLERQRDTYNHEIQKETTRSQALNAANNKAAGLKQKVAEEAGELLDAMRDPHALSASFATAMFELKTGLDRVKLPESAAREFFEELAAEPDCICGRPIDDEIREIIRQRAAQYMGSDDVALLNAMKTTIQEAVGASQVEPENSLNDQLSALDKLVAEATAARNDLNELEFEAERADPAVKEAKEEIDQLEVEVNRKDRDLDKFESADASLGVEKTFGIEVIKKKIKDSEKKLAEITQTIGMKQKRDILMEILESAYTKARQGIASDICAEANRRIQELMPNNNIMIDRIDKSLVLSGQGGGSVGENLSVAYGFLATLFDRSDHQLPFIVDSPAAPIDLAIRPTIAELIPKLTGQFVAFTISSERDRFVPQLEAAAGTAVEYITLFRKGGSDLENAARKEPDHAETDDGIRVRGKSFFNDFQIDVEEVG
jgi:predicted ATP-binding protein involved in virulence